MAPHRGAFPLMGDTGRFCGLASSHNADRHTKSSMSSNNLTVEYHADPG
jgi:hypothetical protein